jgi:hypothetical protein
MAGIFRTGATLVGAGTEGGGTCAEGYKKNLGKTQTSLLLTQAQSNPRATGLMAARAEAGSLVAISMMVGRCCIKSVSQN